WQNTAKLNTYHLHRVLMRNAFVSQNERGSGGQLGGAPAVPGQQLNATIIGKTRFETPEQFREILLKVDSDGFQVRLGDVARVELGAQNSAFRALYNGQAATGIAIQLAT